MPIGSFGSLVGPKMEMRFEVTGGKKTADKWHVFLKRMEDDIS